MICAEEFVVYVGIILIIVVGIAIIAYIYRHPKEAIKLLLITVIAVLFVISIAGAEDFRGVTGKILIDEEIDGVLYTIEEVEPDLWLIPVKTEYGVISFYSDVPEWEGRVYLLLFGEDLEVIDVFMFNDLEKPFGAFLFLRTL